MRRSKTDLINILKFCLPKITKSSFSFEPGTTLYKGRVQKNKNVNPLYIYRDIQLSGEVNKIT